MKNVNPAKPIAIDLSEALRYAGVSTAEDGELRARMVDLAQQCQTRIAPRWVWKMMPTVDMPGELARKMLADCQSMAVLVCTLGATFDTWERQLQARDMAQALLLNGCANAYVEAACDAAEAEIQARLPEKYLTDRFSPGYGDLPLSMQGDLLAWTDATRRLGVTLTESHLLNPIKTVTAIIGLADRPQPARIRGCDFCTLRTRCELTKAGKTCGK